MERLTALLDTHALLWALLEPAKLSTRARRVIEDPETRLLVSAATAWEIATKYRLGRLPDASDVVSDYARHLVRLRAEDVPVRSGHALVAGSMTIEHGDPFDRILAAQALTESVPLVTNDPAFRTIEGLETLW